MQHPWLFYMLFFIFGYVTCRTFYFFKASRKSIALLRTTQVISLFMMARALEHFHYAKDYRLFTMEKNNASAQNLRAFRLQSEDEIVFFKTRSIKHIIDAHGSLFEQIVDFNDWKSAMVFLEGNRELVEEFIKKE